MKERTDWNSIASDYSSVRDSRLIRVFPEALRLLADYSCLSILDYGSGDGRFIEAWLEDDRRIAIGYDPAPEMRRMASSRLARFAGRVRVVADLQSLDQCFDAVTFHAVWMCLRNKGECMKCLSDANRALKSGGIFVASVTHPCFRDRQFATFRTSFSMDNYTNEGSTFEVSMFDGQSIVEFTDYHWSLGEMTHQLQDAGFAVIRLLELPDVDEAPWPRSFPWLIIVARKYAQ